jgi:hypothetical protein
MEQISLTVPHPSAFHRSVNMIFSAEVMVLALRKV